MFGIILFIIGITSMAIAAVDCRKFNLDNLTILFYTIGLIIFLIGVGFSISFLVDRITYNKDVLLYKQKYELISNKLSSFSDNANFINSFSDAYDEAIDYNINIYSRQTAYKCCGLLFSYNDDRILELKQIDLNKYKIKDADTSIKLKIDK